MNKIQQLASDFLTSSNKWALDFIEEIDESNIFRNLPKEHQEVYRELENSSTIGHFYVIDESGLYFKVLPTIKDAIDALMLYSLSLK